MNTPCSCGLHHLLIFVRIDQTRFLQEATKPGLVLLGMVLRFHVFIFGFLVFSGVVCFCQYNSQVTGSPTWPIMCRVLTDQLTNKGRNFLGGGNKRHRRKNRDADKCSTVKHVYKQCRHLRFNSFLPSSMNHQQIWRICAHLHNRSDSIYLLHC